MNRLTVTLPRMSVRLGLRQAAGLLGYSDVFCVILRCPWPAEWRDDALALGIVLVELGAGQCMAMRYAGGQQCAA